MVAVEVESLTVTYGSVTAVDDLSFTAEAGQVTCVLGPNGAGKTSTVEALEGLRRPASGRLEVIGLDPRSDHRVLTERMGVMLQEGGIHPAVRVREALRHAAALYRNPLDPAELIERLGLAGLEGRTYRQLSGGEQRRVALAVALVGRPQVAFLDEPTTGVDPAGRQVIRQVVADLRSEGVTVLLTTHDLDEAERVADRVVIVVGGKLVASGTVEELTRASGADADLRFRGPPGLDVDSLARHLGDVAVREVAPGDYVVATAPTPRAVAALTAWLADHDLPLADLRAGRQRLEDVYLRLTAGAATPTPGRAPAREAARPPVGSTGEPDDTAQPPAPGGPGRGDRDVADVDTTAEHDAHDPDSSAEHDAHDPDTSAEHDAHDADATTEPDPGDAGAATEPGPGEADTTTERDPGDADTTTEGGHGDTDSDPGEAGIDKASERDPGDAGTRTERDPGEPGIDDAPGRAADETGTDTGGRPSDETDAFTTWWESIETDTDKRPSHETSAFTRWWESIESGMRRRRAGDTDPGDRRHHGPGAPGSSGTQSDEEAGA
jgi:ABC-2 type transport system ATP-binding protein